MAPAVIRPESNWQETVLRPEQGRHERLEQGGDLIAPWIRKS